MGLFSDLGFGGFGDLGGIGDVLFGTEDDAMRRNLEQMREALGILQGVPISSLYGQGAAALGQGRQDIAQNFQQAIGLAGATGTGAQMATQRAATAAKGEARQSLANRGLYGSSLLTRTTSGIQNQANQTQASIQSGVAGQQAGLLAGRGQALAGNQMALARLYQNQAGAMQGNASAQAGLLSSYQHQGTPGIFGPLLGAAVGGLGGGLGMGIGGSLFGGGA